VSRSQKALSEENDVLLTGTKFGCGAAQCGACMVHVDGEAVPSCVLPIDSVVGAHVATTEGMYGAMRGRADSGQPVVSITGSGAIPRLAGKTTRI
jgi:aerobic-type carbon monoxide dehydrogenase small subunit (CoxS/CutS family)